MLNENPNNIKNIVDAIIAVHRQPLPPTALMPAGMAVNNAGLITITYGHGNTVCGQIRIVRGQFAVTEVSVAVNGAFAPVNYNHDAVAANSLQSFIDALSCTNFSAFAVGAAFSSIVYLTSESCRSELVYNTVNILMHGGVPLTQNEAIALKFIINNYAHTAAFRNYDINAGGTPWTWLRAADYTAYLTSPGYNGRADARDMVPLLSSYVARGIKALNL